MLMLAVWYNRLCTDVLGLAQGHCTYTFATGVAEHANVSYANEAGAWHQCPTAMQNFCEPRGPRSWRMWTPKPPSADETIDLQTAQSCRAQIDGSGKH